MAQFGVGRHPGNVNFLEPLVALLLAACGGGLLVAVLGQLVPRAQRALRSRRARRRRLYAAATAELRARAMMDELCPYGWHAQIALFGGSDRPPGETPDPHRDWVALDWTAFEDESRRVATVRRVWAPTLGEALDAMVSDRRTDETLQHIEQAALADGALWPDV
jgi:hypothetical protein